MEQEGTNRWGTIRTFLGYVAFSISRVNQMDAAQIDNELVNVIKHRLMSVWKYMGQEYMDMLMPEIECVLNLLLFRFSMWEDVPTPGAQMQNLRYMSLFNSRNKFKIALWQKILWCLINVLGRYLVSRLQSIMLYHGWNFSPDETFQKKVFNFVRKMEILYRCCSVINFLLFLYDGHYKHIFDRFVGIRLVYKVANASRLLSFEFMNQQLVWSGFNEFLYFLLPLLPLRKWKRWLFPASVTRSSNRLSDCPICQRAIILPHDTNCKHLFCYHCIKAVEMEGGSCPVCATVITSVNRLK